MRRSLFAAFHLLSAASASFLDAAKVQERAFEFVIKPKVFIISMFDPEADIWYGIPEFDLLALNITVPGFSPLFPDAHCTADGDICQLVTGESGKCDMKMEEIQESRSQSRSQRSTLLRQYLRLFTHNVSTSPRPTSLLQASVV